MEWVLWLIPLVALAVWILSNLARTRDDEPRRVRPPQARSDQPESPTAPPRKTSNVDQFLMEVRRRREEAETVRKKPEVQRPAPARREEVRRTLPPAQPARLDPQRKPVQPPPLPKVVLREAPPQPRAVVPKIEEVVLAKIVPAAQPNLAPDLSLNAAKPATRPLLIDLLSKKESLTTAFMLREILGTPLCKRPGTIPSHRS